MANQPLILLATDQEEDILLVRRAFDRALVSNPLHVLRDGGEAIAYFAGEGKYRDRNEYPLPWLVLLDLRLPQIDGFQILKWIRQQPELRSLIVIALTSPDQIRDVNRAYQLGANSFMMKPTDFGNAVQMSRLLHEYWLCHSQFRELKPGLPEKGPEVGPAAQRRDVKGQEPGARI